MKSSSDYSKASSSSESNQKPSILHSLPSRIGESSSVSKTSVLRHNAVRKAVEVSKSTPSDEGERNKAETTKIKRSLYDRLYALGMPSEVTLELFAKVEYQRQSLPNNVDWMAILHDLSTKLSGRKEARRVRGIIERAREDPALLSSSSHPPASKQILKDIKQSTNPSFYQDDKQNQHDISKILEDPMKLAMNRRNVVFHGLDGMKKEYHEEVKRDMEELGAKRKLLEQELETRRRVQLLLEVLEKREQERLERFNNQMRGLDKLLDDMRTQAITAMDTLDKTVTEISANKDTVLSQVVHTRARQQLRRRKERIWKYPHPMTRDALAKLHALHIRQSQGRRHSQSLRALLPYKVGNKREEIEGQLRAVLKRLGICEIEDEEYVMQSLTEIARRRVQMKRSNTVSAFFERTRMQIEVNDLYLDSMYTSIEKKKGILQEKIKRAVGLGWLCEETIGAISTFQNDTVPALHSLLFSDDDNDSRRRLEGYIDVLRTRIKVNSRLEDPERNRSLREELQTILGIGKENMTEHVRRLLTRVGKMEETMKAVRSATSGKHFLTESKGIETGSGDLLSGHNIDEVIQTIETSEGKYSKLVERKGQKIEYGLALGDELRKLITDVKRLK